MGTSFPGPTHHGTISLFPNFINANRTMKKVFFFLVTLFSLHTISAQTTLQAAPFANMVCQSIQFEYEGEFRMPNNQVEIRWKAIGQVKNTGNATFQSNSANLGLAVINSNTKASKKILSLAPGKTAQVELSVRYMKGQPNPEISETFVVDGKLECSKTIEVPDWVVPK